MYGQNNISDGYNQSNYIGKLPEKTQTKDLEEILQAYGNVTVVFWWQDGDEWKGKITTFFRDMDYIAAPTGWWNAGHTVILDNGTKVAFHELPGAAIAEKPRVYLWQGRLINISDLQKEINVLDDNSISTQGKIIIAGNAQVVTNFNRKLDWYIEELRKKEKVWSTRKGIWPTAALKGFRLNLNINMLMNYSDEKINGLLDVYEWLFKEWIVDKQEILDDIKNQKEILTSLITAWKVTIDEDNMLLNKEAHAGKKILIECSQANSLALDGGWYPNCTSTDTSVNGALSWLNLPETHLKIAVAKLIKSKVGSWFFPTKITEEWINDFREETDEKWATTSRPRDLGHLDLVQMRKMLRTNKTDIIAFTKADLLHTFGAPGELGQIKVATKYKDKDKEYIDTIPTNPSNELEVIYSDVFDLSGDIKGISTKEDLPENYKLFLDFVIEQLGFEGNVLVGTGRKREELIVYK